MQGALVGRQLVSRGRQFELGAERAKPPGKRRERVRTRAQDQHRPHRTVRQLANPQSGHGTGPDQRRLSAPGRADHGEKPPAPQLLQYALDIRFATKVQVRVLLVERLQPAVRAYVRVLLDLEIGARGDSENRASQILQPTLGVHPGAHVDPRAGGQKRWQGGRPKLHHAG